MVTKTKPNALVIRNGDDEGVTLEYVSGARGRKTFFRARSQWLYVLKQTGEDAEPYEPNEVPVMLPSKLYRCLKCDAAKRLLADKKSTLEKISQMAIIAMCGIFAILVVVVISEVQG